MQLHLPGLIDTTKPVQVIVSIPGADPAWQQQIASLAAMFDAFLQAGAVAISRSSVILPTALAWNGLQCTLGWPQFPAGVRGMGILLRCLEHMKVGGLALSTLAVQGQPASPQATTAMPVTTSALQPLPERKSPLPFKLELCPYGDWIHLQCNFSGSVDDGLTGVIHQRLLAWMYIANTGGFQSPNGTLIAPEFGVGLNGPIVGDDFFEWHCLKPGVPIESLDAVINLFAEFALKTHPIDMLYIG
jgi:hypothetical protein